MDALTEDGVVVPIPPDGLPMRAVDLEEVRRQVYSRTDGDAEQRRHKFNKALNRAGLKRLIGMVVVDGITYVWPTREDPEPEDDDDTDDENGAEDDLDPAT
jgi:hypothetical protein